MIQNRKKTRTNFPEKTNMVLGSVIDSRVVGRYCRSAVSYMGRALAVEITRVEIHPVLYSSMSCWGGFPRSIGYFIRVSNDSCSGDENRGYMCHATPRYAMLCYAVLWEKTPEPLLCTLCLRENRLV